MNELAGLAGWSVRPPCYPDINLVTLEIRMNVSMKAVEVTGTVDEDGQLHLDEPLSAQRAGRVRILLLFEDTKDSEEEWLRAAAQNPAFDFLKDAAEDIYTAEDGKPFRVSG